ncbi:MAG: phosphatase PAP2 family protein [Verrucomicrobia bacterium]|nr:phosphatase PAP2 family protein [Cytophagales bacterium]
MQSFSQSNRLFFLIYGFFILIGGILQLFFSQTELFLFFNSHYSQPADFFFKYWTNLGDGLFAVAVAIALLLFRNYKEALLMGVVYVVSSLLAQALKRFVFAEIARPSEFFKGKPIELHFTDGVEILCCNSFPSGHTATAFGIFCLLFFMDANKLRGILCLSAAFLVAYSRIYLAEHFFVDVYVGSLIGVLTAIFFWLWFEKLPEKKWHSKAIFNKNKPTHV